MILILRLVVKKEFDGKFLMEEKKKNNLEFKVNVINEFDGDGG